MTKSLFKETKISDLFKKSIYRPAIKVALAMVIAYAIALYMGWEKPMWAAFAVAFISLDTTGQSLNKGALRLAGTVLAGAVSLTLLALFAQDRWGFIASLSVYIFICTYMMAHSRHSYFWFVAGFVTNIVLVDATFSTDDPFYTAILRLEETGLGVLVYSLIAALLWPSSTPRALIITLKQLSACAHKSFTRYVPHHFAEKGLHSTESLGDYYKLLEAYTDLSRVSFLESYRVWELQKYWEQSSQSWQELGEALEVWRQCLEDIPLDDLAQRIPWYESYLNEVNLRFSEISELLETKRITQRDVRRDFSAMEVIARDLPPFDRAAFSLCIQQLHTIERITFDLRQITGILMGRIEPPLQVTPAKSNSSKSFLDLGQAKGALRASLGLLTAFLLYIYIPDFPSGPVILIQAGSFGIMFASNPFMKMRSLLLPGLASTAIATVIYVLVMPALHSFWTLAPVVFLYVFAVLLLLHKPEMALARALCLLMFITITDISNEQTYSFLNAANSALVLMFTVLILGALSRFPFRLTPEKQLIAGIKRIFSSAEYLVYSQRQSQKGKYFPWSGLRRRYHLDVLSKSPENLRKWAAQMESASLKQGLEDTLIAVETLSLRTRILAAQQPIPALNTNYVIAFQNWRQQLEALLNQLAQNPISQGEDTGESSQSVKHLVTEISETFTARPSTEKLLEERLKLYRLLGSLRGLNEAISTYKRSSKEVDWPQLLEARF
ncbi:FUSC family protein [Flexibacterium corallicola]|uniref:FUSC family protein n=1 Tax=Flexibacterium corallicola TaxID=3037259 RepID=UPI00286F70A0|nr:FUSC family protein [Pseudovibrio sp. M1P-2-3]